MPLSIMLRIARFYSSEFLVYPLESLALIMRRVFTVGLLLLFWHLVAQDNDIRGLQIVPYILIATGAQFLTVGQNFRQAHEISEDIKHGRMNNLLIRPVSVLRYELGAYIGKNVFEYAFSTINILLGIWFVSGLDVARLGLFLLSLIPALTIGYALNVAVAAAAFWLIEITYFRLLTYFMLRIISGMFVPLTFFTGSWAALQYFPTAQLAFVPSYIVTGDDLGRSVTLVLVGLVQTPVMLLLAHMVWRKGLRQYGAVGI